MLKLPRWGTKEAWGGVICLLSSDSKALISLCFSFQLPLHLLSSSYKDPAAPRRINFYFFFEQRGKERGRRIKALQPLPPFSSLSLFQRSSDHICNLCPVYFRSTSWISLLHSSELESHRLPHASYLPPFLPSFLPLSLPR